MNELKAFRNNISNYNYNKKKIKKLEEQIEDKFYSYFGVKCADPSKQPLENKNLVATEMKRLEMIEKFEEFKKEKETEIDLLKKQNKYVMGTLFKMDDITKNIFILIYIKNKSYKETCKELNINIGELQYLMKKAFKED